MIFTGWDSIYKKFDRAKRLRVSHLSAACCQQRGTDVGVLSYSYGVPELMAARCAKSILAKLGFAQLRQDAVRKAWQ